MAACSRCGYMHIRHCLPQLPNTGACGGSNISTQARFTYEWCDIYLRIRVRRSGVWKAQCPSPACCVHNMTAVFRGMGPGEMDLFSFLFFLFLSREEPYSLRQGRSISLAWLGCKACSCHEVISHLMVNCQPRCLKKYLTATIAQLLWNASLRPEHIGRTVSIPIVPIGLDYQHQFFFYGEQNRVDSHACCDIGPGEYRVAVSSLSSTGTIAPVP